MEEIKIKNRTNKKIDESDKKIDESDKKIDEGNKKTEQKNIVTKLYPAYVSEYPIDELIHYLHR